MHGIPPGTGETLTVNVSVSFFCLAEPDLRERHGPHDMIETGQEPEWTLGRMANARAFEAPQRDASRYHDEFSGGS